MDISASPSVGISNSYKLTAAATTNLTSAVARPCKVTGGYLRNRAAAEKWVKVYDKVTAPVVATDVPKLVIGLPAGAYIGLGDIVGTYGYRFALGLALAITGAEADTDATAVAAGDVSVNFIYA